MNIRRNLFCNATIVNYNFIMECNDCNGAIVTGLYSNQLWFFKFPLEVYQKVKLKKNNIMRSTYRPVAWSLIVMMTR